VGSRRRSVAAGDDGGGGGVVVGAQGAGEHEGPEEGGVGGRRARQGHQRGEGGRLRVGPGRGAARGDEGVGGVGVAVAVEEGGFEARGGVVGFAHLALEQAEGAPRVRVGGAALGEGHFERTNLRAQGGEGVDPEAGDGRFGRRHLGLRGRRGGPSRRGGWCRRAGAGGRLAGGGLGAQGGPVEDAVFEHGLQEVAAVGEHPRGCGGCTRRSWGAPG
jgi:hypothetical protein